MLIATDYARKMSLDMRMIDPECTAIIADNKANHCAAQIAHYYRKYDQHKGTQFVFSDLGTWKPGDEWNVYAEIKRKLVEDHGIPASEVRFIQEAAGSEGKRKKMIEEMNTGTHPRIVRLDRHAGYRRERPEAVRGDPPPRQSVAALGLGAARRTLASAKATR